VRLPVSRVDRNARLRTLEARYDGGEPVVPHLDVLGTLEYRGAKTQLSAIQARLIEPMIERFGAVVARERLLASAWPDTDAAANSLDVTVGRLRRQLVPVGLKIRTVRSRGYLLCDDASS
jgi:DNA-binding response OmpR family regulator